MAAANVEGLARAVAALSRESARADATIRELQAVQQDMRAQLTGKAGLNELQAVAQRRGSKPGDVRLSARGDATPRNSANSARAAGLAQQVSQVAQSFVPPPAGQ